MTNGVLPEFLESRVGLRRGEHVPPYYYSQRRNEITCNDDFTTLLNLLTQMLLLQWANVIGQLDASSIMNTMKLAARL